MLGRGNFNKRFVEFGLGWFHGMLEHRQAKVIRKHKGLEEGMLSEESRADLPREAVTRGPGARD